MKKLIAFLSILFLLGCESDPGRKKIPLDDPRLVSKGVGVNFFPKVDILFVVDDSASMLEHQTNLANNVDGFLDKIFQSRFIDFHIGVTTSNDNESFTEGRTLNAFTGQMRWAPTWNGRLINLLDRRDKSSKGPNYVHNNTPDRSKILRSYLTPGVDGDGDEKFFSMVRNALTAPHIFEENFGFYRPDAHLLLFFLTDAEDQSFFFRPQDFYDFLLDLKGGNQNLLHYAGAIGPSGTSCRHENEPQPFLIEEFTALINGKNFNICEADYGVELVKIANNILELVSRIALDEVPVVSTIKVTYGSQTVPHSVAKGWTYNPDENVIYISKDVVLSPEPEGTALQVSFEPVF